MKKLVIFLVLVLFCLNSCYYIKQAILDEKTSPRRGIKLKNSFREIFDTKPFDIREVKNQKKTKIIEINKMNEAKDTSSDINTR